MNVLKIFYKSVLLGALCAPQLGISQDKNAKSHAPIIVESNGQLRYTADALGDRVPDFSFAGYMARERSIPTAPVKIVVPPSDGDATLRIQSAIDYVASLPADDNGIRGAVLLLKGTYRIEGQIKLNA